MSLPSYARLNIDVDGASLERDLRRLGDAEWAPPRGYSTTSAIIPGPAGWTALPLRSQGGSTARTDPGGPGMDGFADTDFLAGLPAFADILRRLPCELRSARLLALHPGTGVRRHRDDLIGLRYGQVRLHVPIQTNDKATITIDGTRAWWAPGAAWYGDFSLPHSIANNGDAVRVHLVVDCLVAPDLLAAFPPEFTESVGPADILFNPPCEEGNLPVLPGPVRLPGTLAADLLTDPAAAGQPQTVTISASGRHLTVLSQPEARPLCRLERLATGEWRMRGWTAERTFAFDRGAVTMRVRRGSQTRDWPLRPAGA